MLSSHIGRGSANLTVNAIYQKEWGGIGLEIRNHGSSKVEVGIFDAYSGRTHTHYVQPHDGITYFGDLHKSFGWYDFTVTVESDTSFQRQVAGHVETGRPSMTDPAIGAATTQTAEVA